MTASNSNPSEDLPEEVVHVLKESSNNQLREIIHYAQQLLSEHLSLTDEIEPRKGEEIVRIDDHGAYTSVIVKRPEKSGIARGPFAYHVQWEPTVEGEGGQYKWHYLGRVKE